MSWHYLQEQEVEYSEESYAVTLASELLRLRNTQGKFFWLGKEMDSCQNSQSGTMCVHLEATIQNVYNTLNFSEASKTSLLLQEDSHAKILVQQTRQQLALKAQEVLCGLKCYELFVKYDQKESLLKTHQCLLNEVLHWSQLDLPNWGMTVDGVYWGVITQEDIAKVNDVGLWPRPCKSEGSGGINQTGSVMIIRNLVDNGQLDYLEAIQITRGQIHKKNLYPWREQEHKFFFENEREEIQRRKNWHTPPKSMRVGSGLANRVDRLAAIGNAQDPNVVKLAWDILQGD